MRSKLSVLRLFYFISFCYFRSFFTFFVGSEGGPEGGPERGGPRFVYTHLSMPIDQFQSVFLLLISETMQLHTNNLCDYRLVIDWSMPSTNKASIDRLIFRSSVSSIVQVLYSAIALKIVENVK